MIKSRFTLLPIAAIFLFVIISMLPVQLVINAAKYAEVSREMLQNNDWINLTIGGVPYDQKPPMLFWIGALTFQLFGFSIPAYKLVVLLCSMLGAYSIFRLGKLLYSKETGLWATVFWLTSMGYYHFNNDIHTDTLLASTVVFSVWQFLAFFRERKAYQFALGAVGVGLSMLTKGPVGIVIPAVAVGTDLLARQQWRDIFNLRWLAALVIVAILILPALMGLLNQFGLEGIKFYFWTNNMGRITGSYQGSSEDYSFYLHTSLYMLLPWTIFFVVAFFSEIKMLFNFRWGKTKEMQLAPIAAVLVFVGILSIAKQKNPHYLLSAIPFIFLITAKWTVKIFNESKYAKTNRILSTINKVIAVLMALLSFIIPFYIFPEKRILFWVVYGILVALTITLAIRKQDLEKHINMLALGLATIMFILNVNMLPNMLKYHTSIAAAEYFNEHAAEGAKINMYERRARLWNILLYSKAPGYFIETKEQLAEFKSKSGEWIYIDHEHLDALEEAEIQYEVMQKYSEHKALTSQSINFLNPKKRAARFRTMYLVKVK